MASSNQWLPMLPEREHVRAAVLGSTTSLVLMECNPERRSCRKPIQTGSYFSRFVSLKSAKLSVLLVVD
jgi:hypothetical protein